MSQVVLFAIQIMISFFASMCVVIFWKKSLRSILIDLCQAETRADFWLNYSNIMTVITPMLFVFLFGSDGKSGEIDFIFLKNSFGCALFGIFFSILVIGLQISRFITIRISNDSSN